MILLFLELRSNTNLSHPPPQYPSDLEGDGKMTSITPLVTHVIRTILDLPDKHDNKPYSLCIQMLIKLQMFPQGT